MLLTAQLMIQVVAPIATATRAVVVKIPVNPAPHVVQTAVLPALPSVVPVVGLMSVPLHLLSPLLRLQQSLSLLPETECNTNGLQSFDKSIFRFAHCFCASSTCC
jgi:hypothetical protein